MARIPLPDYPSTEKHQVTLYITDSQYKLLSDTIEREHKRAAMSNGRPHLNMRSQLLALWKHEDWKDLKEQLAENVW